MPRAVSQGESLIINPYDIANLFNNYFSSVADIAKENINQSINQSINHMYSDDSCHFTYLTI